ncbi:MAG: trypsin-like peptidase domain-containing protein [Planctomycetaceae bacterium]|nr:trypsin-like peptidase domain-containing protein [Planctomycetaceae bacterium]
MTRLLAFLCCFYCFNEFTQSAESSNISPTRRTPTQIALEEAQKAVVNIEGDRIEKNDLNNPNEIGKAFNGMGTGVLIDPRGYIVTNHHVIDGIREIKVTTCDNKKYKAVPIARDPVTDIAIIKISDKEPFSTIKIGRSADVLWAEDAYAIGNPYGYSFSASKGVISGLKRDVPVNEKLTYALAIQTSVPINPGNSGGPLLNNDGEMIGINAAIRQGTQCIAFAIPVDQVVEAAARLIQQHTASQTYHGIRIKSSTDPDEVIVESVEPESPAAQAGIQPNDRLLAGNQVEFHRPLDFSRSLLEMKTNETLTLSFLREGEEYSTNLQLIAPKRRTTSYGSQTVASNTNKTSTTGRQPSTASVAPKVGSSVTAWDYLGIKFTSIPKKTYEQQYPQYLENYPDGAIRVTEVRRNSPMGLAGIEVGDMIFGIKGFVSSSEEDVHAIISDLLENRSNTSSVDVLINRPYPYDGEPANGHFSTVMELP